MDGAREGESEREEEREREGAPLLVTDDLMEGSGVVELWRERLMYSPGLHSFSFHTIFPEKKYLLLI